MQTFRLSANFLEPYKASDPAWGWSDAAGNSIGELTFVRTYSRIKEDGSKEKWWEVCERVINGMYSLLKDHCLNSRLDWNGHKAQASAQEAYDRMFHFKWTPPGRGLFQMGTPLVMEQKNAASLQNCASVSTGDMERHDPGYPFAWTTEALMLGVGVGFDTLGAGKFDVFRPGEPHEVYEIPDTREGWAISVGKLINSYLKPGKSGVEFDYGLIRPHGASIKTFGGTASGPEPLEEGHQRIRKVLDENVGAPLTAKTIVDIQNIIGSFVVAGNSRRSAELALGLPTDEGFVDLKNPDVFDRPWGFMSNNSISAKVGMDYTPFLANTATNGEPGYVWLDVARKYGRLIDPPDFKDARVTGFNPCLPAWSPVITKEGLSTIGEIQPGDYIWSEDGWVAVLKKWSTGIKSVYRHQTTAGHVDATEDHRIVQSGEKVELSAAESIDRLRGPVQDAAIVDPEAVMAGLLIGDGYRHEASNNKPFLCVGEKDHDYFSSEVAHLFTGQANGHAHGVVTTLDMEEFFGRVFDRRVPDRFMRGSVSDRSSFLRGLYSANGSICGDRVALKTTSFGLLQDVQTVLSSLGIASYYTTNQPSKIKWDNGTFESRESYDLNISRVVDVKLFKELIGFVQRYKCEKLDKIANRTPATRKELSSGIRSREYLGDFEVFDITVSGPSHTFWSGGHNISNCVEQPLESYECCCLVEAHLNRAESKEDFLRTLKFAYLYGKSVTLLTTPWEKTNAVMLRNRRIGLSTTGVAGFVEERSLADYRVWADEGYKRVSHWDVTYSEWLGVRESIRKTTVKPSGSVSLLSGATPGVHWPPGGEYFVRAIRFGDHDNTWRLLESAGYKVEDDVYSPNTKVVYFPLHSNVKRAEGDVSIFEKIHLAAEAQKYWSDNGVSVTVSFDPETESEAVGQVLGMYEGQLKAVSFLPMGNTVYEQQPYTRITQAEYEELSSGLRRVDLGELYNSSEDAAGEVYCTTDACELK